MTTVADIITAAMRETNVIGVGQTPTVPEAAEGLSRLQALVLSTLGTDVGYIMEDWSIKSATNITKPSGVPLTAAQAAAFTVAPNARLVCGLTAATALLLDPMPQDGQRFSVADAINSFDAFNLTLNPNGRKIGGVIANAVLSTEGLVRQWFYRADIADWKQISPLASGDEFPFPEEFDDFFIVSLAMRLNPRYGKSMTDESKARLTEQKAQINYRYSQTRLRTGDQGAPA